MLALPALWHVQSQEPSLDSVIEIIRADMRADRATIITEAMKFSDKDAAAFWPIYRKYEYERSKLDDRQVAVIKEYAEKYPNLSDADAKAMAERMFDCDSRLAELKKGYFKKFNKVLPAFYGHEVLSIGTSHRFGDGYESGVISSSAHWNTARAMVRIPVDGIGWGMDLPLSHSYGPMPGDAGQHGYCSRETVCRTGGSQRHQEEESHIIGRVHESRCRGGTRIHAEPTISCTGGSKRPALADSLAARLSPTQSDNLSDLPALLPVFPGLLPYTPPDPFSGRKDICKKGV